MHQFSAWDVFHEKICTQNSDFPFSTWYSVWLSALTVTLLSKVRWCTHFEAEWTEPKGFFYIILCATISSRITKKRISFSKNGHGYFSFKKDCWMEKFLHSLTLELFFNHTIMLSNTWSDLSLFTLLALTDFDVKYAKFPIAFLKQAGAV